MSQNKTIKWLSFEEAMIKFNEQPKEIFIDIYTDWCGWCKRMDQSTFKDSSIVRLLSENYYPVKLDAEMKRDIILFKDTLRFKKYGRSGAHELALNLLSGHMQYPSYVVLDHKLSVKKRIKGYKRPTQLKSELIEP